MSQYPIYLGNPTYRAVLENVKPNVRMLLRNNPRIRNLIALRRNDQLGVVTSNMPDFSGGGSYSPVVSNSPSKFETIFNGALSIGSQIIAGWGKNQTTQIAANNGKVSALPSTGVYGSAGNVSAQNNALALAQANAAAAAANGGLGLQAGKTIASGFDSLANSFGVSSTTMFIIGGIGIYLLFRPSPGARR